MKKAVLKTLQMSGRHTVNVIISDWAQGSHCVILPPDAKRRIVTPRLTVLWLRHCVRSSMPSGLLPRCCDKDESENCRQLPVSAETREQCLRRVELELVQVVDDQKTSANCSGRQSDQPSVCDDAPSPSWSQTQFYYSVCFKVSSVLTNYSNVHITRICN